MHQGALRHRRGIGEKCMNICSLQHLYTYEEAVGAGQTLQHTISEDSVARVLVALGRPAV